MSDTTPSWYHGCMSAEEATAICMKVGQNGAFLLRQSQGIKGAYTLSMFFEGEVYHHRVATTKGRRVTLQSANKEFKSLEKLVEYYMSPREEFFHPLTVAIYPSLVKRFNEENENWRSIHATTPLYDVKKPTNSGKFRALIPKPNVAPRPATEEPYYEPVSPMLSPKQDNHNVPTSLVHVLPSTSTSFPTSSCKSASATSAPDEESWPAPLAAPPIKPKPRPNPLWKTRSVSRSEIGGYDHVARGTTVGSQSKNNTSRFTTFGKTDQVESQDLSRAATGRPHSCVFPSDGIQVVSCEIPDGSDDTDGGKPLRRRTMSLEDHKLEQWIKTNERQSDEPAVTERKYEAMRLPTSSPQTVSQNITKSAGQNKKSKLKTFANFISRVGKSQPSPENSANRKSQQNVEKKEQEVKIKEENREVEKEDEMTKDTDEANNNQTLTEQYTPILCKTQFVTTTDYSTSDNAMNFAKGTEMAIKGVRVDGWWFCHNKATQETGWVHMDYLKPMSNEKWFEAKPVETTQNNETYEKLDFTDFDSDSDDDNYCRYLIPNNDMADNGENSEHSEKEVSTGPF